MVSYHRASTDEELQEIKVLQQQNLKKHLSLEEQKKEGFVSIEYPFEVLKKMNEGCAHCIAKKNNKIVGYALSTTPAFKEEIPFLTSMFQQIEDALETQAMPINYIAMGQICIDKPMRGKGVFKGLYQYMHDQMKPHFDAIITEVAAENIRSFEAHTSVGFQLLKKHIVNNALWKIIILHIKK